MKAFMTLVGFAVVFAGLCAGWVDAGASSSERVGVTTVSHMGDRS